jgi:hypothetical protein
MVFIFLPGGYIGCANGYSMGGRIMWGSYKSCLLALTFFIVMPSVAHASPITVSAHAVVRAATVSKTQITLAHTNKITRSLPKFKAGKALNNSVK